MDEPKTYEDPELKALYDQRKLARRVWHDRYQEHPFRWRMTHNDDGRRSTAWLWVVLVCFVIVGGFYFLYWQPQTQIGGTLYHLQNGINYQCPGGDWHGNTSQMVMIPSGTCRYYYCPDDGRLIGFEYWTDPLPWGG